MFKKIALLQGF